jgi:hypothetical protein
MLEELFDKVAQKTVHKSGDAVKKEVKKKVDAATTGENGQKLLLGCVVVSAISLIFSLRTSSKPVVVNVYNNVDPSQFKQGS